MPVDLHVALVSRIIAQFQYIKIQPKTTDVSTRLQRIYPTHSVVIPQSLVLRSLVLAWILIYRNWSVQNRYCRAFRLAENVLNVEYSIWWTKILSDFSFAKNCPPVEREGEGWQCSSMCWNKVYGKGLALILDIFQKTFRLMLKPSSVIWKRSALSYAFLSNVARRLHAWPCVLQYAQVKTPTCPCKEVIWADRI